MTSNAEKSVKFRSHRPAGQLKFHHDLGSVVDKENIEYTENKTPAVSRKLFISPTSCAKPRKQSDSSYEQALRPKGLQGVDKTNSQSVPKKRNLSLADTSGVKPLSRTRFSIYDDDDSKRDNNTTEKSSHHRCTESKRSSVRFEEPKSTKSYIPVVTSQRSHGKLSSKKSSCSARVSPTNLPHITQPNVLKIKETHRRSTLKKTPETVYDILSLELAYNMDYMSEYVRFQMEINEKKSLSPSFLKRNVTSDQRRLIVKYLFSATTYFKYPSFILYQTVKIFDSYIDTVDVDVTELQIVSLAALWIELKKDFISNDIPEASRLIQLGGKHFSGTKELLIEYEKKILMSLNFEISFADPFSMLSCYTIMVEEVRSLDSAKIKELYYCGCYLMDLSLMVVEMLSISAVHLAAISAEIALMINMSSDEDLSDPQWTYWRNRVFETNPIIERYRLPESQMNDIRNTLLQTAIISMDVTKDYHIVYKKYNTRRYGLVTNFIISKISTLYVRRIRNPKYGFQPIYF